VSRRAEAFPSRTRNAPVTPPEQCLLARAATPYRQLMPSGDGSLLHSPRPVVSAIVVTWRSADDLRSCLGALASEADAGIPLEVVVVDCAGGDRSADIARECGAAVVVEPGMNLGFARAVNAALPHCRGRLTLLLNPDVEISPGSLAACVRALDEDPLIGLVGCDLRRPDGSIDPPAARRARRPVHMWAETLGVTRLSPRLDVQFLSEAQRAASRDVEAVNGAFMLLPTDLLRSLGGLDDTVFMYLEDMELCRRLRARGLRIRFVREARATHLGGASAARAEPQRQALIYQHRADADIEFARRVGGEWSRASALLAYGARGLAGYLMGAALRRPVQRGKYRDLLRWLVRQVPHRTAPRPVL
jgi:GT2 family glycosyltransferase